MSDNDYKVRMDGAPFPERPLLPPLERHGDYVQWGLRAEDAERFDRIAVALERIAVALEPVRFTRDR